MPSIEKEPIYDVYCISRRQYQRFLNILFWRCLSGAVGSVDVWCSARRSCHGRGFESLFFIYCLNLHQLLILCSSKAMMFVKLYFRTSDIYLISPVSVDPSGFCELNRCHPLKRNQYTKCIASVVVNISASWTSFWGCLSGAVGSVDVLCSARRSCHGRGFESR